jgi:hypothetical protein
MTQEEQGKTMGQIIAKCWADEAFKQKLLADPATTLKAEGLVVPEGLTVKVVEDSDTVAHLVIPARPDELSDDALSAAAGGNYSFTDPSCNEQINVCWRDCPGECYANRGWPPGTYWG